jgi:hypothetical protein
VVRHRPQRPPLALEALEGHGIEVGVGEDLDRHGAAEGGLLRPVDEGVPAPPDHGDVGEPSTGQLFDDLRLPVPHGRCRP